MFPLLMSNPILRLKKWLKVFNFKIYFWRVRSQICRFFGIEFIKLYLFGSNVSIKKKSQSLPPTVLLLVNKWKSKYFCSVLCKWTILQNAYCSINLNILTFSTFWIREGKIASKYFHFSSVDLENYGISEIMNLNSLWKEGRISLQDCEYTHRIPL